jgi:hypothetical protein
MNNYEIKSVSNTNVAHRQDISKSLKEFRNLECNFMMDHGYLLFDHASKPDLIQSIQTSINTNVSENLELKKINAKDLSIIMSNSIENHINQTTKYIAMIVVIAKKDFLITIKPGQHHSVNWYIFSKGEPYVCTANPYTEIIKNIGEITIDIKKDNIMYLHPHILFGINEINDNLDNDNLDNDNLDNANWLIAHTKSDFSLSVCPKNQCMWNLWEKFTNRFRMTPLMTLTKNHPFFNLSENHYQDFVNLEMINLGNFFRLEKDNIVFRIKPNNYKLPPWFNYLKGKNSTGGNFQSTGGNFQSTGGNFQSTGGNFQSTGGNFQSNTPYIKLGEPSMYESTIEIVYYFNTDKRISHTNYIDSDRFEVRTGGVMARLCNAKFSSELYELCKSDNESVHLFDLWKIADRFRFIDYNALIKNWYPRSTLQTLSTLSTTTNDNGEILSLDIKKVYAIHVYKFDQLDCKNMNRIQMILSWIKELQLRGGFILSNSFIKNSPGYMIVAGDDIIVTHRDRIGDLAVFQNRFKCFHWKKIKHYHYSNNDNISEIKYDDIPSDCFCFNQSELNTIAQKYPVLVSIPDKF